MSPSPSRKRPLNFHSSSLSLEETGKSLNRKASIDDQDSDSDSSIEFLLTIAPPTPAKKVRCDDSSSTTTPIENQSVNQRVPSPPSSISPPAAAAAVVATNVENPREKVVSKNSAYLQSLAEICHAILYDGRWRVGAKQRNNTLLISWERGDDLSAVRALSRSFQPLPTLPEPQSCPCLGSRCSVGTNQPDRQKTFLTNEYEEEDEAYYRALNLFSRMYFRKGPFFRVDDLCKYYLPRSSETIVEEAKEPYKPNSPSKFFLPRKQQKQRHAKVGQARHQHKYIDSDMLKRQMDSIGQLLDDLQQLHSMGLLRTFLDEKECAMAVGEQKKYGLLRQEEQSQILVLLGCKKNKQGPTKKNENLIWKQMSQQTSITSLGGEQQNLLPVIKHVNNIILNSWATSIVLKSSTVDYMPTAMLKSITETVKADLIELVGQRCHILSTFATCIRLREAPLKCLHRCCRLYLCATSGPGSMRGDGTTAWRSLPGSHSKDLSNLPLYTNIVQPPGAHSWHSISYPGKDYRFKLSLCNFMRSYEPILMDSEQKTELNQDPMVQVFSSVNDFNGWELTVELRANVDYLIEMNDLLHYNHRKKTKGREDDSTSSCDDNEALADFDGRSKQSSIDFLDLLTRDGRKQIVHAFVQAINSDGSKIDSSEMLTKVEDTIGLLLCPLRGTISGALKGGRDDTECEKILAVIAAIAVEILTAACSSVPSNKIQLASKRPWLRHMRWEGCLAYILWDVIQILEKRGCHVFAVKALEVLLFGKSLFCDLSLSDAIEDYDELFQKLQDENKLSLTQVFLSRRARGKAYVRLIIDYIVHRLRKQQQKKQGKGKGKSKKKDTKQLVASDIDAKLSKIFLEMAVPTGKIPFSAARALAKRLKQPLAITLSNISSFESRELGLRYSNDSSMSAPTNKYSDWRPVVDQKVANSMLSDDHGTGKRCSYIGFEENGDEDLYPGSLNVEELAMEYYRNGKLPPMDTTKGNVDPKGGFVGWHDEGFKVRQLWRVLASHSVLGMDFGCVDRRHASERATVFLTPYQSAPFDLHCGAEVIEIDGQMIASRGFYERRKDSIEELLNRLSSLSAKELSDLVYDSVQSRYNYSLGCERVDPMLERDVLQVRSLSLLAAGMGGKMLSSIFRCFFFDYRHYSGGLPDLLLVRATSEGKLVDLGEWIGEDFLPKENKRAFDIFEDRDGEFLGCSKVGDSGGRLSNRFRRRGGKQRAESQKQVDSEASEKLQLPARLELSINEKPVRIDCIMVEVKSHNDTLDNRQADWLNVLDKEGNARVCKFNNQINKRNTN